MELKNIQFRTTVLQNNRRHHGVYFEPHEKQNVINNFLITYSNSKSVQKLISDLQNAKQHKISNPKYIGIDESHIFADENKAVFDMELVTDLKPVEIGISDAIEFFKLYKEYLKRYENSEIPGLEPVGKFDNIEWDYIGGWEKDGKLESKHLIKWAYVNNGYFSEQDEDLLMYRPELISTMHELMIDEHSKRKEDLFKILKCYANHVYLNSNDDKAILEFKKLINEELNDKRHLGLKQFLIELEKKAR
jgi:hypothetical protein